MLLKNFLSLVAAGLLAVLLPWYDYPFQNYGLDGTKLSRTTGLIVKSDVISSRGSKGTIYSLDMQYEYVVNEKKYNGYQIGLDSTFSKDEVNFLRSKFKTGNNITVYYNPSNPDYSLLIRGIYLGNLILRLIISMIVFFLCTALFMITSQKFARLIRKENE